MLRLASLLDGQSSHFTEKCRKRNLAVGEVRIGKRGGGHIFTLAAACKQTACRFESLIGFFFAVNQLGKLIGKLFLGFV